MSQFVVDQVASVQPPTDEELLSEGISAVARLYEPAVWRELSPRLADALSQDGVWTRAGLMARDSNAIAIGVASLANQILSADAASESSRAMKRSAQSLTGAGPAGNTRGGDARSSWIESMRQGGIRTMRLRPPGAAGNWLKKDQLSKRESLAKQYNRLHDEFGSNVPKDPAAARAKAEQQIATSLEHERAVLKDNKSRGGRLRDRA